MLWKGWVCSSFELKGFIMVLFSIVKLLLISGEVFDFCSMWMGKIKVGCMHDGPYLFLWVFFMPYKP